MEDATALRACVRVALRAGREIRDLVHAMPPIERARPTRSILKPHGGYGARRVDADAEALAVSHLRRLADELGLPIELVVDAASGETHRLEPGLPRSAGTAGPTRAPGAGPGGSAVASAPVVWCFLDAIDGTVKVAGLGPLRPDRVRLGNDGGWAAGFTFTAPTSARLEDLRLGDFAAAVLVDGNPPRWRVYPQDVVAVAATPGRFRTFEVRENDVEVPVFTSTGEDLDQMMVFLDVFQAHDLDTRREGDDRLGVELYRRLTDRHAAGAFEVVRQYANLSALPRVMLGWREGPVWVESQGGGYLVVNENLPNLVPCVPIMAGAGGCSVDLDGRPLLERRLVEGRTSVLHAANPPIRDRLLDVIDDARRAAGVRGTRSR